MARMRRKTLVVCLSPATKPSTQHPSRKRRSRRTAQCTERCPLGSEEGCAEKARTRSKRTRDLAAQPILYEQVYTANIYIHADMSHKERAIGRIQPPNTKPGRYRPVDNLLAFLEAL
jgi:hypothetical protein